MRVLTRWNILITCTNEGRLHGPVAGFNILSLPGPVERLTGNNNFFPQELRGVPVPKVVRTEIGVEAVLILYTQRQRQAREKEKQNGEHKQKTNTKSKTIFFMTSLPLEQDQPVVGNLLCTRRGRGGRRTAI